MSLARYEFLPWLREGLGNTITEKDTLSDGAAAKGRPSLKLQLDINNQKAGEKDFLIVGPADVIGFSKDLVIRTVPVDWSATFPSNLLAHIEFYDEDFPWRYSPARPDGEKLRPWISLIVLQEKEFTRMDQVVPLPQIEITDPQVLPSHEETWLWAHVQKIVSSTLTTDASISDHIISRLVCPRKLAANTRYYAFVIPTFEGGRLAGLGKTEDEISNVATQEPAWTKNLGTKIYPVYYEWFFRTADEMDFEYLVSLLEPKKVDPLVGKKALDCRTPGFGIPNYKTEFTLYLEGALKAPQSAGAVSISSASASNLQDFQKRIKDLLNQPSGTGKDPVVTPPFYGQKHIFEQSLDLTKQTWIHQLNRDPTYRAVAGMGARVFEKYQDHFLQKAWEQLESVVEANKLIDAANAAMMVCQQLYENIIKLPAEEIISLTGPVHVKVRVQNTNGGESTLYQAFLMSCFNGSVYTGAFRRLTSRRGVFRRKLERNGNTLELESLKKLLITRARQEFTLPDSDKYTIPVIDRPEFTPVFRPAFEDRLLAISPSEFENAVNAFADLVKNPPEQEPCEPQVSHAISENINPSLTITRLLSQVLIMPEADWFTDPLKIKAALAYPDFEDPMYEKLKERSAEWLIPNLHLIPNNSITLLEANRKFIEAFMVGLNLSMNKEMRWREYPTDERASCFRQFWDVKGIKDINNAGTNLAQVVEEFKDISPIHTWKNWKKEIGKEKLDEFGTHNTRSQLPEDEQLVLVLRGDLLKYFPNTTVYAARAKEVSYTDSDGNQQKKLVIDASSSPKFPVFKAEVGRDLKFIGFDITVAAAKGNATDLGWFFVMQETPGETRFGLDIQEPDQNLSQYTWDDMSWALVKGKNISKSDDVSALTAKMTATEKDRWGRSSADMAYILYQKPIMIAIHAKEMIP